MKLIYAIPAASLLAAWLMLAGCNNSPLSPSSNNNATPFTTRTPVATRTPAIFHPGPTQTPVATMTPTPVI